MAKNVKMNINKLHEIRKLYGLSANKKLGQNFLIDGNIIRKIVEAVNPGENDIVLEIGPGLGSITGVILERSKHLTAVEIDSGAARYLKDSYGGNPSFRLIHSDFFKYFPDRDYTVIVSNLPYYCASEILFNIASRYRESSLHVMVQREMAARMISRPGTVSYGAMTVTLSYYYRSSILFNVPPGAFYPAPDVTSSFIRLERRDDRDLTDREVEIFHLVVKSAFWGRRKTLLKGLTASPHLGYSKEIILKGLAESGIDGKMRGEELDVEEYIRLARILNKLNGEHSADGNK